MNSYVQGRTAEAAVTPMLRVVVVDDSIPFGDLAAALLEREPHINLVGVARSGADALEMVASLRPDLVIMDVQMTPMGGLTAAALIWWLFPRTRVVMMSTDDSPRLRAECTAVGAQAFIHKAAFISEFVIAVGPVAREVARDRAARHARNELARATAL